ncbi:MAG: hypothetical protein M1533_00705 [Candidatus Thermoplasmatota archaeon]|nr:hypothetical protein [Candidatus Thermoplasmatota archaeon]MCL5794386.1 hypothetical protein [Candidatus Thermoplasmatota archaeon]
MRRYLEISLVFSISLLIRLLIFFPGHIPTGDVAQYATFVKEISLNGGGIPSTNTLYMPGSDYIYPPLLFLGAYYIGDFAGLFGPLGPDFYINTLFIMAAVFSALCSAYIYHKVRRDGESTRNFISAFIVSAFSIDLYTLTWGGYPYIFAQFLLVLLLFQLDGRGSNSKRWIIISSVLAVLIAFSHDLTYFLMIWLLIVITAYDLYRRKFQVVYRMMIIIAAGLIAGIIWWLPRVSFVISALFLTQGSAIGPIVPINNIFPIILAEVPFSIPLVFIAIFVARAFFRKELAIKADPFTLSFVACFIGLVFLPFDETVVARIALYAIFLIMIVLLRAMYQFDFTGSAVSSRVGRGLRKKWKIVSVLIVLLFLLLPVQYLNEQQSIHYYSSGSFQYDPGLVHWAETHMAGKVVVAPSIGEYISAVSGAKVIIYSGYFVGTVEMELRNAGAGIILMSGSNSSLTNVTDYQVSFIIVPNYMVNTTVDGKYYVSFSPAYYEFVERFSYYTVYQTKV